MQIKSFALAIIVSCCAAQPGLIQGAFALPHVEDIGEALPSSQTTSTTNNALNTLTTSPVVPDQNTAPKATSINEDLLEKIHALEQTIPEMQGKIDELQHELKRTQEEDAKQFIVLNQKLADMTAAKATPAPVSAPVVAKTVTPVLAPVQATDKSAVVVTKTANSADDQEKKTYDAAYSLITAKAYTDAIEAFTEYLSIFPEGKYAANANYWLGELNANQQKYPDAIKYLEVVVDHYPQSSKASDAMLKLGIINKLLGNDDKAQSWFNKLVQKYPQSKSAQSAKQYIV